jgi:hypothetical protein
MFTHTWSKYLPVIKILLKRSQAEEQIFNLNVADFQNKGAKKTGEKFSIQFSKGKAGDMIRSSAMAKDLASVLLNDNIVHDLFLKNEYHISMNSKFQLTIQFIPETVEENN